MKSEEIRIAGNIVDVLRRKIFPGEILIRKGRIADIREIDLTSNTYITPGWVDSHIHIESSMLTPQHFSNIAVRHGTTSVISDPHEIANVMGLEGINYMIENARKAHIKFWFGAPSCVPATPLETSGAILNAGTIAKLMKRNDIHYLSEMMNYPGVLANDPEILEKIAAAFKNNKPVDGHAPGLTGEALKSYVMAGITTDHECFDLNEAREKIQRGMKIQIREGSAAKNFEALYPLIDQFPGKIMLCSDDLHPDDLLRGHLNLLLKRGVEKGLNVFNLLETVTLTPVKHYGIDSGLLRIGDAADLTLVDSLTDFKVKQTWINGTPAFSGTKTPPTPKPQRKINRFVHRSLKPDDFIIPAKPGKAKIIQAIDGELITRSYKAELSQVNGDITPDPANDILKIAVVNRYNISDPQTALINGFGLKQGAVASSIAHDSHNLIAVGTSNKLLAEILQWIMDRRGGIAVHDGTEIHGLELPVAGIMSALDAYATAQSYANLDQRAKSIGSILHAPFMTLSFMSLLVIPELKIGDLGLFDVNTFAFTSIFDQND
jgi:adenine deaminase